MPWFTLVIQLKNLSIQFPLKVSDFNYFVESVKFSTSVTSSLCMQLYIEVQREG